MESAKVVIIGSGRVGAATATAVLVGGFAREIVMIDDRRSQARGVAFDLRYGGVLRGRTNVREGLEQDLAGSAVVVITAGVNEKDGGAAEPGDPVGRMRLAEPNRGVYERWAPSVARHAPDAVLLAVTDPPDPLADLAATLAPGLSVISSGTLIDSLRFRYHLGERFEVDPASVDAVVLGEHGLSAVQLWSQARIAGLHVEAHARAQGIALDEVRESVASSVREANIAIIKEGTGASQYGIGVAAARIVQAIVDDERRILPVGSRRNRFGVTLSLPSIVGRRGVLRTFEPEMTDDERRALEHSAEVIARYARSIGAAPG